MESPLIPGSSRAVARLAKASEPEAQTADARAKVGAIASTSTQPSDAGEGSGHQEVAHGAPEALPPPIFRWLAMGMLVVTGVLLIAVYQEARPRTQAA